MEEPFPVVGPEYCISDHPVELGIVRKALALTTDNFKVTDVNDNNNDLFKVKVKWSLHGRRVLHDIAGNPIITLRNKMRSIHSRWQVFRGDSHDKKDLLFTTVSTSTSCLQFEIKLNVFLANNEREEKSDFRLKGSFFKGSCIVYTGHGNSKSIIAQMCEKTTSEKFLSLGKTNFKVTVNPNVDHVFIIAMLVILHNIDTFVKEAADKVIDTIETVFF